MKLIESENTPEIQALSAWCRQIGRSHVTVWRWRENGWLTTVNIAGRPYITRETIREFKRRAAAGAQESQRGQRGERRGHRPADRVGAQVPAQPAVAPLPSATPVTRADPVGTICAMRRYINAG